MSKKRILLIGDFSSVHSELKLALENLGHEVILVSGGDGFKNLQRDLDIKKEAPEGILQKMLGLLGELTGLRGIFFYFKIRPRITALNLSSFNYIQVINPLAIQRCGAIANLLFWRELKKSKAKVFLCALGTDYAYVKASLGGKLKYHYFSLLKAKTFHRYVPSLRFAYFPFYSLLHRYAVRVSKKVIPGLVDYEIAYAGESKRSKIIPLPISSKLIKTALTEVPNKIIIFYGKQKGRDLIKGYKDFDQLIERLKAKYPDKLEFIVTENIPYDQYLNVFSSCHIFLDQTNSHDRGVNALIGMGAGKVVLSGGGPESLLPYESASRPLLNASPDIESMLSQIEHLIENPSEILKISQAAVEFVRVNHDSSLIARQYLELWASA